MERTLRSSYQLAQLQQKGFFAMFTYHPIRALFLPVLCAAMLTASSALQAEDKKEDKKQPAAKPDRYTVPQDAGVEELLKFIDGIKAFQPTNVQDFFAHRVKAPEAIVAASRKILELEKDETSAAFKTAKGYLLEVAAAELAGTNPKEQQKTLTELTEHLAGKKELAPTDIRLAMTAASGIERSGNGQLAQKAYNDFAKLFSESENEQITAVAELLEGAARRVGLVGKEMEVKGKTFDGKEFDLANFRGKVVLIDFWATWCGPCVAEVPNMKRNYERYHEQGFEIVGISLDDNRETVGNFITQREIPWIILHHEEAGSQHPVARHYGIMSIPAMILVDQEGKVVSLKARGEELNTQLEKLLGKAESSE